MIKTSASKRTYESPKLERRDSLEKATALEKKETSYLAPMPAPPP